MAVSKYMYKKSVILYNLKDKTACSLWKIKFGHWKTNEIKKMKFKNASDSLQIKLAIQLDI